MINLERPPPTQRTLSFVETEAAAFPLAAAAPEVMMKYIESLDGAGEGIFQNNRIAQLKPNCPPFVTVCPGLQLRLAAHLLTEDTTGRLFSQLVTTIGARHPARRRSGKTYFFHLAKTETERQALAAFSRALGHRGSTAPFWPDTSKTGDAASRPTIGWSLQSKSRDWT